MTVSKEVGKVLADRIRSGFYQGTPPGETLEIIRIIYQQRLRTDVNATRSAGESPLPKRTVKP